MSFIVFNNGRKPMTYPPDKAREVYKVWKGLEQGTPEQKAFVKTIKNIYFANGLVDQPKHQMHWADIDKDIDLA